VVCDETAAGILGKLLSRRSSFKIQRENCVNGRIVPIWGSRVSMPFSILSSGASNIFDAF
jgi:hypothetical protein